MNNSTYNDSTMKLSLKHDEALFEALGSTDGSACTTSSMNKLSPKQTTTIESSVYNTLEPPISFISYNPQENA